MKRASAWYAISAVTMCLILILGCKKRYFPRVTEEIVDPGVPVYQETVVE